MINKIIEKIVEHGYDSLTANERFLFDKYQAALEYEAEVCNE